MPLPEDIDRLAQDLLPEDYELAADNRPKAIHDAVWGTQVLLPWEVDLLDAPLIQRLRGVKQTGLASYTYPSAQTTRFEHTLGCLAVASRLFDELKNRRATDVQFLSDRDKAELRLAALLHDAGHGVFSHASESVASSWPGVSQELSDLGLGSGGTYEAFSHLLVKSAPFAAFFEKLREKHDALAEVDIGRVADLIVGRASPERRFLASIISGPFDADKLDYISRDSRASGLELVVDLPRLLYAMDVRWIARTDTQWEVVEEGERDSQNSLVVRWGAASVLEQILFAKVQLYVVVYYHAKVRGAESLARRALRAMKNGGLLGSPVDLLRYSDDALLEDPGAVLGEIDDRRIIDALGDIAFRRLPRRAAVLSGATYDDEERRMNRIIASPHRFEIEEQVAAAIATQAGLDPDFEVIVDLPSLPPLNEAARAAVLSENGRDVVSLNQTFPAEDWLQAYVVKKWRGHVFGPSARRAQADVFDAAVAVFDEVLGVRIKPLAGALAHVG